VEAWAGKRIHKSHFTNLFLSSPPLAGIFTPAPRRTIHLPVCTISMQKNIAAHSIALINID
jgi:hypothetical protein